MKFEYMVTMWVSDGVLDVLGNCGRSATPNALLKS
jgi:hypothetical protein